MLHIYKGKVSFFERVKSLKLLSAEGRNLIPLTNNRLTKTMSTMRTEEVFSDDFRSPPANTPPLRKDVVAH